MLRTFLIAFSLKMTYRVNAYLYRIREIRFLRFLFRPVLYRSDFLKSLVTVLAALREVFGFILGKGLYFAILGVLGWLLSRTVPADEGHCFLYAAMVMTLIGGMINSEVIDADMDTYYAVVLLRMDAKKYALSQFLYDALRQAAGFLIGGGIVCLVRGFPAWVWLTAFLFAVAIRFLCGALSVVRVSRRRWDSPVDKLQMVLLATGTMIFMALVLPPVLKAASEADLPVFLAPKAVLFAVCCAAVVLAVPGVRYLFRFDRYDTFCRKFLSFSMANMDKVKGATTAASHSFISGTAEIRSDKSGFEFLDDLFVKRHRKLLWRRTKIICAVIGAALAVLIGLLLFLPASREGVANAILKRFAAIVFLMYIINRGASYTQALFVNCDAGMLNYNFYREPGNILRLFRLRLRDIILVNLPPALLIGAGLAIALVLTGAGSVRDYLLLLVSSMACMLFFSVHYLTLYYLLQPYTQEVAVKSLPYQLINLLVYIVSYMLVQLDIRFLPFAIGSILFGIAYALIACLLVYRLAPKTFRIRKD